MSIVTAHEGVNRVPKSWYASAGGVNRKLKSIFAARDGVNQKIFSGYDFRAHSEDSRYGQIAENGQFFTFNPDSEPNPSSSFILYSDTAVPFNEGDEIFSGEWSQETFVSDNLWFVVYVYDLDHNKEVGVWSSGSYWFSFSFAVPANSSFSASTFRIVLDLSELAGTAVPGNGYTDAGSTKFNGEQIQRLEII